MNRRLAAFLVVVQLLLKASMAFRMTSFVRSKRRLPTVRNLASSATVDLSNLPPVAPSGKRLFLVRHGEVINPGGDRPVYYGAQDVSLSPLGKDEAKAAADCLASVTLARVYASPLSRAIFGAHQVAERQEHLALEDVMILEGFKELDRGAWCGQTKDEIGADAMARFDACDESVTPKGGESYPALKRRVLRARDECLSRLEPGEAGCVVSHLQVTRCMLSDCLGIATNEMAGLKIATASITCIDYDASGEQVCHFHSFKPDVGLAVARDGAN